MYIPSKDITNQFIDLWVQIQLTRKDKRSSSFRRRKKKKKKNSPLSTNVFHWRNLFGLAPPLLWSKSLQTDKESQHRVIKIATKTLTQKKKNCHQNQTCDSQESRH